MVVPFIIKNPKFIEVFYAHIPLIRSRIKIAGTFLVSEISVVRAETRMDFVHILSRGILIESVKMENITTPHRFKTRQRLFRHGMAVIMRSSFGSFSLAAERSVA